MILMLGILDDLKGSNVKVNFFFWVLGVFSYDSVKC